MALIKNINFLEKLRNKNPKIKIGICHGVFDIIHAGHINHFEFAKSKSDILIVSITSDKFVNKGEGRPYNDEVKRAKTLAAMKCIDYIFINDHLTSLNYLKKLKPNFYFKGKDFLKKDLTLNFEKEKREVIKYGGKLLITPTELMSSTKIFNNLFSEFNKQQKESIRKINKNYGYEFIEEKINSLEDLELNLVGETILDEYVFCDIAGLASKDPCFSTIQNNKKIIQGGALSVCMLASQFVKKINFYTFGKNKTLKSFLNKSKNKAKLINLSPKSNIQIKTRYLNLNRLEKILQVTNFRKNIFDLKDQKNINKKLKQNLINKNLIICDFGVGLFEDIVLKKINKNKNIYLNVQTNSLNQGYNIVSKYNNAFYVSLDEREWRLAFKNQSQEILNDIKSNKTFKLKSLTKGKKGSVFIKNGKSFEFPVYYNKTVDTTGCGDAYFMITSLMIMKNFPSLIIPFLGNIYAGMHSQCIGNETVITKNEFLRTIKRFLTI